MSERGTTVLIAGVPRSGTTWIGECLSAASTTAYVHEPDNELARPSAARAKRGIGPYPVLAPGESAPEFDRLWERLFDDRSARVVPQAARMCASERRLPLGRHRRQ
jgi:hypothetical protein